MLSMHTQRAQASAHRQCRRVLAHPVPGPRSRSVRVLASSSPEPAPFDTAALRQLKVLVVGATGGCGKNVVDVLVEQGVQTRALVRDPAKAKAMLSGVSQGLVEVVKGDTTQYATLPAALGDCNVIVCATGARDIKDPFGSYNLSEGVANLVALGVQKRIKKFVLVTSIGTDDIINPLNLFWGTLFWKKREEETVQRSGLNYTVVRPGGLKDKLQSGEQAGNVVMKGPGYYGLPPSGRVQAGSILRRQVAEVCVAALTEPAATNKVVEIVAVPGTPKLTFTELYEGVTF